MQDLLQIPEPMLRGDQAALQTVVPTLPTIPIPLVITASGLYEWQSGIIPPIVPSIPIPIPDPIGPPLPIPAPGAEVEDFGVLGTEGALLPLAQREEVRLDIDGRYPQMMISGTRYQGITLRIHWIAKLASTGTNQWKGAIWYKDGTASAMPYTQVEVKADTSLFPNQKKVTVRFSGGGTSVSTRTYKFKSTYFHPVQFEYDHTSDANPVVVKYDTCAHPNRPSSLPCETLTIENVFRRAGFDVKKSGGDAVVPSSLTGGNGTWSDNEMHDAMQVYWSQFANKAQWSLWALFAKQHDMGSNLGGIMFDSIGPNHRQGTAVFTDSFIANPPANDPNPSAWVKRNVFWTACHEMGHAFNLAHSWQKSHPPTWGTPWIPLSNEPEARSFMNYPSNVSGGQSAFFSNFEFRFSDQELRFMRHAPARFVQMGNADWFDHHGFEQAAVSQEPTFALTLRANRPNAVFDFLEPVVIELKLTNTSGRPEIVDENLLSGDDSLALIIKKDGKPARQWNPYARYCRAERPMVLLANQSLYDSAFVATGLNGWDVADPGYYTLQAVLNVNGEDIVSAPYRLKILPPRSYDESCLAQDFFSDEVGRALAFDGTQVLESANNTLHEVAARLSDRPAAIHARVALAVPRTRDYKQLVFPNGRSQAASAAESDAKVRTVRARSEEARAILQDALVSRPDAAAESLGHVDYKYYVDRMSEWLRTEGDVDAAAECQSNLLKTLTSRNVARPVLKAIEDRRKLYRDGAAREA